MTERIIRNGFHDALQDVAIRLFDSQNRVQNLETELAKFVECTDYCCDSRVGHRDRCVFHKEGE